VLLVKPSQKLTKGDFIAVDRKLVKPDLALRLLGVIVWEMQAEEVLASLGCPHDKPTFGDGHHRGALGKQRDTLIW
jgi:hypothetical protein